MLFRFVSVAAALASGMAAPLHAQSPPGVTYTPPSMESDPADALSRYLRMLASNPVDLASLTGAGKAALDIGDPSAALGFYARAEEIAPKNGRIKAGISAALVQMEQPDTAMRFFDEAVRLGVPVVDIAADRGLAFDLRGEPRRAQADYATALRSGPEPETTRRLALSQAIGGNKLAAIATLRPLLARRDPATARVQAFVLALTGDSAGAATAAAQAMPGDQAAALLPYLTRLGALKPAEKAAAVHFGRFPADRNPIAPQPQFADAPPAASLAGALLTPKGTQLGGPEPVMPEAAGARRRPGQMAVVPPQARTQPAPAVAAPPKPVAITASPVPTTVRAPVQGPPAPEMLAQLAKPAPVIEKKVVAAPRAKPVKATEPAKAVVAEKKPPVKKAIEKTVEKKPAIPERYWVQVASGSNKRDLGKVWSGLRTANKTLAGQSAWTTAWRASNRLLVGPFKTESEAQGFVNRLAKGGMSTMQFTSRAGVNVERLATP